MTNKTIQKITALHLLLIIFTYTASANDRNSQYQKAQALNVVSAAEWQNIQKQLYANINSSNFQQQTYLKGSNTKANDAFGASLAMSGNTLVVGAYGRNTSRGGVYVFTHTGGTWSQQAYLVASNRAIVDMFGWSVAISGDTLVVGAYQEDSNAIGVNGDEGNNLTKDSGAAYVFTRTAGTWSQQAYLKASNTDVTDRFGWSVSISGNLIAIGALSEASNATGINADEIDNSAIDAGAVYVFERISNTWSQQAYIKSSNNDAGDVFGHSVAIAGNVLVVGAPYEDSSTQGIDGDETDNSAISSGAAYIFAHTGGTWNQQAYIKASNTDALDQFGSALAISGDTIVIGAYLEDGGAVGVNGDETNNYEVGAASGAAYIFTNTTGPWSQQAYLKASNTGDNDYFGRAVDIFGDTVVVGAYWEDSDATSTGNSISASGITYVFTRTVGSWNYPTYFKASNAERYDEFGKAVAVADGILASGARLEDSNATIIGGDDSNNDTTNAGAVYAFSLAESTDLIFANGFE